MAEIRDDQLLALHEVRQHGFARHRDDAEQKREYKNHERERNDDFLKPFVQGFHALRRRHRRIVANFFHISVLRK